MDMVILGCVCWFLGQTGGSSLRWWSAGIRGPCQCTPWVANTSTHFHTHIACVEGISVMTVRITFSIRLPGASYLAPSDRHTQRLLHRSSTSGELLVIIGKSFEGCQYSDGGDAGLLNMVCKTHPACQQSTCSPQLNDLVN